MEDLKLKLEIRKLEQEMQANELPKLREENRMLREKIIEHEKSLKIVDWYIDMFEEGRDTRAIAEQLSKLTKNHKKLVKKHTESKEKI